MKRHFYIIALILPILLFSCKSAGQIAKTNFDSDVIQTVKNMNTRQKIGQVLMVNFRYCKASEYSGPKTNLTDFEDASGKIVKVAPLTHINTTEQKVIQNYHIGNVILFAENLSDLNNAAFMISDMQLLSKSNSDLPLIISVDQEGGRVNRIFQTATFPPAKTIGNTQKPELAYAEGKYLAMQLKALGINLNFAPVCDVDSNPSNPVIGNRSFSSNPETAGEFASQLQCWCN